MRNRSLGRYELLQLLGSGPSGAVSLAKDGFAGGRLVAVKVVDPRRLPPRGFARLQREFLLRRGLRNPHLAELCDLDFDDAGRCRLVSEYVGGSTLPDAARELGPDAIVDLAVQLLQGLGHLHDCGLLHGAIKPGNVRLDGARSHPCVKLLDFGLRTDPESWAGETAAALHYAAPEVLRGQPPDLGADLYGVGMLLHHAIAGALPFEDPAHGPGVVAWHLNRNVRRAPAGHVLSDVVERLLGVDPESRFRSTHEVVRAVSAASGRRLRSRAIPAGEQVLVSGRFIGRERESERLAAACRRIVGGAGAQILLLIAPPGMGKTRALEECRVLAQMAGVRVVHATCGGDRAPPLGALRELLRQVLVLVGADSAVVERHRRVLQEILPEELPRGDGEPEAPDPGGWCDDDHRWVGVRNGAAEFLASVAQLRPLMLLVDDVQAIDESSLDALRCVFRHFSACPLMLVGGLEETPPGVTPPAAARLIEEDAHEVLRLGALQVGDVAQLVSGVLSLPGSVRELSNLVLRLTGGVPLYVEELVRAFLDGQMIDLMVQEPAAIDGPGASPRDLALDLVGRRLDRLEGVGADLLAALCLCGGQAPEQELAAMVCATKGDLGEAVRRLERADLVRAQPTCSGARVAFTSDLLREAVDRRIAGEERARIHDRIAEVLEERAPASPETTAAIAFHRLRGRPCEATLPSVLAAARAALAVSAFGRARTLLEAARKLPGSAGGTGTLDEMLEALAAALAGLGEPEAALIVLGEVLASARAPAVTAVAARVRVAGIHAALARSATAHEAFEAAARDAEASGDPVLVARVQRRHARLFLASRPDRALVLLERSRALVEDRPDELVRVLGEMGEAHRLLGEHALSRRMQAESLAGALRLRDRTGAALAHLNLGLLDWAEGDGRGALRHFSRCRGRARRMGQLALVARALYHAGVVEGVLGRLSDAVRTLTQSVTVMRQIEDEPGVCEAQAALARVHHDAGRHEMARTLIEDVVTRRGRLNDLRGVASARVALGRILSVAGSLDEAETLLRTAADAAEHLDLDAVAVDALGALAEVAVRRGRLDDARALLDRQQAAARGRREHVDAAASDLVRAEIACETDAAAARPMLGRLLRRARATRNAAVLAEARRLSGRARSGLPAVTSLLAAGRAADRAGFREIAWRVRSDLGFRLLASGEIGCAMHAMQEAMTVLRALHDELPASRREAYIADPRKRKLREEFADVVDRMGVPVA